MIGSRLGSWILDRELGRGGMGRVFLAHHAADAAGAEPRLAAVKVLKPDRSAESDFLPRFQREVEVLRQLDHPGIVRLFESGSQDGLYFYAMEFVPGPNLETVRQTRGRLPWPVVLDLGLQIAPALKHAHDRGVIHRDLKPSNLLCVTAEPPEGGSLGPVKLTDFGVASLFASTHLTSTGFVVGTPEYLSPEQAAGKPVTRRSDLYSLGAVLYTLLTGRTVFEGEGVDLLHKHLYGQVERPIRLVPDLPPELDTLICQMLDKDPSRRPADGAVLHRRLDSLRRKMERKAAGGPDDTPATPAQTVPAGAEAGSRTGPATLMSRLMRRELERQNQGGPVKQFFNRPWVIIPLFLLTLGLIVWSFWPASAEGLYRRAAARMASENPDDWERAGELLDRLEKMPDHPHAEEVAQFRRQLAEHEAAQAEARKARQAGPMGEAEWFYQLGLRQRQQGNEKAARQTWQALIDAFDDVPAEAAWVKLARKRLEEADAGPRPRVPRKWEPVRQALRKARELREEGKNAEADAIRKAVEQLYRDEPGALELLKEE
jgi:hypothetical protein